VYFCALCGEDHPEKPEICQQGIRQTLTNTFELILGEQDTVAVREMICNYAIGYMGASFGLHVKG
jgi:hypothetical protein